MSHSHFTCSQEFFLHRSMCDSMLLQAALDEDGLVRSRGWRLVGSWCRSRVGTSTVKQNPGAHLRGTLEH